jgi:hypothetical protein
VFHQGVRGYVVSCRLGDAAVALASHRDDLDPEVGFGFLADRLDIVSDQADGAGAEDRDALGLEDGIGLSYGSGQLLLGSKDYVRLLDVC